MPTTSTALLTIFTLPALLAVGVGQVVADDQPATAAPPTVTTEVPAAPTTSAPADDAPAEVASGVEPRSLIPVASIDLPEPALAPPLAETSFVSAPTGDPLPELPAAECVDGDPAEAVATIFESGRTIIGADYQRAFPLPSGRVLWLFQDAFVPTAHGPELVHNVGLVQSGSCFQLLRSGSAGAPTPYLFADLTDRYDRWFWPLGGEIGADGLLHVFVAEMIEHSGGYLQHTEPIVNWLVTIDPDTFEVVDRRRAPDASASLYGWSVVSSGEHTYLFAHCYRQFGWDELEFPNTTVLAHDFSCAATVTVARIPRGHFAVTPEYWNGSDWTPAATTAVNVFPVHDRWVNPAQVAVLDGRFVSVTKVGDWWGETIHLDVADRAEGPWETYGVVEVESRCDECNTYFASIVPFGEDDASIPVAISNNTWGGHDLSEYVPAVLRVPTP